LFWYGLFSEPFYFFLYIFSGSYIVDVIGIVTDIQSKRYQETNAVKVTLNDKRYYIVAGILNFVFFYFSLSITLIIYNLRGTCECILVGMYAEILKTMMSGLLSDAPILLLQFVQIKNKGGLLSFCCTFYYQYNVCAHYFLGIVSFCCLILNIFCFQNM
jgi:hypothetical protein